MLLRVSNGNQGQITIHFQISETINQLQWLQDFKRNPQKFKRVTFTHFNRVDLTGSASGSASGSLILTWILTLISVISSWQKKRSRIRVGLVKPNKQQKRKGGLWATRIKKLNKEAMWLYAELFLGIWNVQKCQNVQILKLLGVLCRNK